MAEFWEGRVICMQEEKKQKPWCAVALRIFALALTVGMMAMAMTTQAAQATMGSAGRRAECAALNTRRHHR